MNTKLYTCIFQTLQFLKKKLGIKNFEAYKKKLKRSFYRNYYRTKFSANELISIMKEMGLKKGSTVFIHSSMTEFYNYTGTANELIDKIIETIGVEGTLLMPAYPAKHDNSISSIVDFDVNTTPSGAGYLTEVFRKYPNVKRSINIQHSVCAWGKMADYFTNEHHLAKTTWDELSPYYKMSQMNTLVFAFGLPYFLGTMIHCTESILCSKYRYFNLFFRKTRSYSYKDWNGEIGEHTYLTNEFARKRSKKKIITNFFDKNQFQVRELSNLRIEMVDAQYTLKLFLELAERGITMYSVPAPKNYLNKYGKFALIN